MNIFNSSLTLISNLYGKLLQLTADITLTTKYSRKNVCIYVNKPKGSCVHLSSWPQWMTFFIMMSVLISGEELLWSRSPLCKQSSCIYLEYSSLFNPNLSIVCEICVSFLNRTSVCWYTCIFFCLNVSLELLSSGIRTFTKLSVETFNNYFIEHSNLNFWFI